MNLYRMRCFSLIIICLFNLNLNLKAMENKDKIIKELEQEILRVENLFVQKKSLNFSGPEVWYRIPIKFIVKESSKIIYHLTSKNIKKSPLTIASIYYTGYDFLPWKFCKTPDGFWDRAQNQRKYLSWLADHFEVKKEADWYGKINANSIKENHGEPLIRRFGHYTNAIKEIIPNVNWKVWLFNQVPRGFWNESKNRRDYFMWLFQKQGEGKNLSDFIQTFNLSMAEKNNGSGFAKFYYKNSIEPTSDLLNTAKQLKLIKITSKSRKTTVRRAISLYLKGSAEKELSKQDIYGLKTKDLLSCCSAHFKSFHQGKPTVKNYLKEIFPEMDLHPWLLSNSPPGYFDEKRNRVEYIRWLMEQLDWEPDDLYEMTNLILWEYRGQRASYYAGGIYNLVSEAFPDRKWDASRFGARKAAQSRLYNLIEKVTEMQWVYDYRGSDLRFSKSKSPMEFDVYLPNEKIPITIEYQGEQHYQQIDFYGPENSLVNIKIRDKEKSDAARKAGIALFYIPYKWDLRKETLVKYIKNQLKTKRNRISFCLEYKRINFFNLICTEIN